MNKHLSAHNEYLHTCYTKGNFICSGRKEPRFGGIILAKFSSLNDAKESIKKDSFLQNEIADCQITEFILIKSSEAFH